MQWEYRLSTWDTLASNNTHMGMGTTLLAMAIRPHRLCIHSKRQARLHRRGPSEAHALP